MFSISSSIKDFPKSTRKRYKVVVNAGGGLFGYIITNFMSYLDFDLYSKIDVAAGTSIGGILAMMYSIQDDHYELTNKAFSIFGPKIFENPKTIFNWNSPKYENKNLKMMLKKLFKNKHLSDIKKNKIIITSTDFTLRQPRIFENINLKKEQDFSLIDVGLCTSAAPTYFPAQEIKWKTLNYDLNDIPLNEKILLLSAAEKDKLIQDPNFNKTSIVFDGGLLENIPIITTYVALHNELGVNPEDIDMFVIGTGSSVNSSTPTLLDVNNWSKLDILKDLIVPYITNSNEQTSIFWGLQMGFNSFTYFNPIKREGKMDDKNIMKKIEKECLKYKNEFILKITEFLNK